MNGTRWRFLVDHKGRVAEISPQLGADHAQIVGHLLSDDLRARVTVLAPGQETPNPTHPGDAPVAFPRWVVYSPTHGQRWAVIAGWVGQAVAKKVAQKIADMTQASVGVIEEYRNNPRERLLPGMSSESSLREAGYAPCSVCGGAGITDDRGAGPPDFNIGPECKSCHGEGWIKAGRQNPGPGTPDPVVGDRWPRRGGGPAAEVLQVKGPRIFFRAGGDRGDLIVQDFKAKFRPPVPWSGPMVGRTPNPKRRNPGDYVPVVQAAKELRATLKRHFPGVKFSVRSKSYSGGASIRVSYENGPRGADVDRIAQRFAGADFDGMTDLKTPRDSLLVGPDGTMRSVRYGSDFVFVNRDVSPTLADAVIAQIGAKWDSAQWAKMPDYEKERLAWRGVSAIDIPNNEPEATTAVRAAEAYFRGEGLTATNPSRSPAARERRASSRLKTLKPRRLYRAQAAGRRDKAGRFLSDTISRGMAHTATPAELSYRNPIEPVCYGQVRGRDWVQEWYETASRHAGARARQLRKLGYRVSVSGMGQQVTPVGTVNMTLVDYRGGDLAEGNELPPVKIVRMNPRRDKAWTFTGRGSRGRIIRITVEREPVPGTPLQGSSRGGIGRLHYARSSDPEIPGVGIVLIIGGTRLEGWAVLPHPDKETAFREWARMAGHQTNPASWWTKHKAAINRELKQLGEKRMTAAEWHWALGVTGGHPADLAYRIQGQRKEGRTPNPKGPDDISSAPATNPTSAGKRSYRFAAGGFTVTMPRPAVVEISAQGENEEAIEAWREKIKRPPAATAEAVQRELMHQGYDEHSVPVELDFDNWAKILMIAADNIADEEGIQNPTWRLSGTLEEAPDAAPVTVRRRRGRPPKLSVIPISAEPEAPAEAASEVPFEVPGPVRPSRGFQPGERVTVPYTGRESYFGRRTSRTRDRAIVEGYHLEGSEPMVQVRVLRGRGTVEDRIFPERQVRRRPRSRFEPIPVRSGKLRDTLERKVRGSLEAALSLKAKLEAKEQAADAIAREWYGFKPKWGETNKHYINARAKLRRLRDQLQVLGSIIGELGGETERVQAAFAARNPHRKSHGAAGRARTVRGSKPKRNPRGSERDRAVRTFEKWHEFKPHRITRMKGPPRIIPRTLVKLGDIRSIDYISDKWEGRPVTYTHKTDRPRPVLATDPDGRHLHIVGGRVKITADGLVH